MSHSREDLLASGTENSSRQMVLIQIILSASKGQYAIFVLDRGRLLTCVRREYSLGGSYRKILHLPKELSWSVLKYTDPDVALAQADEDKLLGFDPPAVVEDGKFVALQIHLQLGTAAYATMALREVTKTETSSYFQTILTQSSEDQKYKTSADSETVDAAES